MKKDLRKKGLVSIIALLAYTFLEQESFAANGEEDILHETKTIELCRLPSIAPSPYLEIDEKESKETGGAIKKLDQVNLILTEIDKIDPSIEGIGVVVARALGKVLTNNGIDRGGVNVIKFGVKNTSKPNVRVIKEIVRKDLKWIATQNGQSLTDNTIHRILYEIDKPLQDIFEETTRKSLKLNKNGYNNIVRNGGQIAGNTTHTKTKIAVGIVGGIGGVSGIAAYNLIKNKNNSTHSEESSKKEDISSMTLEELEARGAALEEREELYNLIAENLEKASTVPNMP